MGTVDTNQCPQCHSKNIKDCGNGLHECLGCHEPLIRSKREGLLGEQPYYIAPHRSGTRVFTSTDDLPHAGDENT